MKNLLLIIAFIFVTGFAFGQNSTRDRSNQFNLGVGLSGWGVPFYIGIDHYVSQDITIGGEFSYRNYNEHYKNYYYDHSIMGFSGNANYHFNRVLNIPSDWDIYAGLNLGFYVWNSPDSYVGNHNSGLGLGGQVGARYFLSNKVGLNLEFGGGNAFGGGKFGITVKF